MITTQVNPDLAALGLSPTQQQDKSKELGAEDFLKLMITQFRHQDPMKPLDSGDFIGQLAQFGTVTGLQEMRQDFSNLAGSLVSNQALQASSLLGRDVLVNRSSAPLAAGGTIGAAVELTAPADHVQIQVVDASGKIVRTLSLGAQPAGLAHFAWDGRTGDGAAAPAGNYGFVAQSIAPGGTQAAAPVLVSAPVESVTIGGDQGGLMLTLQGLGEIPFSAVRQIG
jgi:flagellar basal-body rod modification protein FlgD